MIENRKNFIVNSIYVAIIASVTFVILKFTVNHLMPFVIGFMIAFLLKPIVRKLDDVFGQNKWVGVLVTILFYSLVLFLIIWGIFGSIAFIQHAIPKAEQFTNSTVIPMANEVIDWFEKAITNLDPKMTAIVDRAITEFMNAFEKILNFVSSGALSWITVVVSSTPKILIAIVLSVISSFFFSMDYEYIVGKLLALLPASGDAFLLDLKNDFSRLIGKYMIAYGKLMFLTFIELSVGFMVLRIKSPIYLAAIISLVDVLPVLGTGSVLIPWAVYEILVGSTSLGIGILIVYGVVTVVRNVLEPRVVGKQIGLHPLLTLVSIYIGVKFMGFWGLFVFPIFVTIFVQMHKENRLNLKGFFLAQTPLWMRRKAIAENIEENE